MRTDDFRPSDNVEDDRETSASRGGMPGGGTGGLGIGTVIIIGLISWYFGIDPSVLLNGAQILTGGSPSRASQPGAAGHVRHADRCDRQVRRAGARRHRGPLDGNFRRRRANLSSAEAALFARLRADAVRRSRKSAMGPFYCPRDQRIYLDTSFFDDLQNKFGGCTNSNACKFSEAYVIAHEVGHHVQNELGILPRVTQMQQASANRSRSEPPASPHRAAGRLFRRRMGEPRRSRSTASSIRATSIRRCRPRRRSATTGCKKQTQGYVVPDSFTHGTSEQRKRWFSNGFNQGKVSACDTLSASAL